MLSIAELQPTYDPNEIIEFSLRVTGTRAMADSLASYTWNISRGEINAELDGPHTILSGNMNLAMDMVRNDNYS